MFKLISTFVLVIFFFNLSGSMKHSSISKSSFSANTQDQPAFICEDFETIENDVGPEYNLTLIPTHDFLSKSSIHIQKSFRPIILDINHANYLNKIVLMVTDLPPPSQII